MKEQLLCNTLQEDKQIRGVVDQLKQSSAFPLHSCSSIFPFCLAYLSEKTCKDEQTGLQGLTLSAKRIMAGKQWAPSGVLSNTGSAQLWVNEGILSLFLEEGQVKILGQGNAVEDTFNQKNPQQKAVGQIQFELPLNYVLNN